MSKILRTFCIGFVVVSLASPAGAQIPAGDVIGQTQSYVVKKGDRLSAVARQFDLGAVELQAANPQVAWPRMKPGDILTLPTQHILPAAPRQGIVINLAAMRLFYFTGDGQVQTFPISVGREGRGTPVGVTSVVLKRKNPTWTVPASIRAEDPSLPAKVPPGPKNPLGQFALNLGWAGYAIHGTNAPSSIGKPASHGCVRMYPEDIARLFSEVEVGTEVTVIDQSVELGRQSAGHLYLQAVPDLVEAGQIARYRRPGASDTNDQALASLQAALAQSIARSDIDMSVVSTTLKQRDGLPVDILRK